MDQSPCDLHQSFADAVQTGAGSGPARPQKNRTHPESIETEITERGLEGDQAQTIALLRDLKSLGVRISVDDFGTGYSSLSRLKDFPLDKIKIDQSFVAEIDSNPHSSSITQSIITLGHALGLVVLAEGVETEEQ